MRLRLQQKQVDLLLSIVTVPGVQEEAQRNGVETEQSKDKSSSCDVYVTCDDVHCFFLTVLKLNWCCISRGLIWPWVCNLTFLSLLFFCKLCRCHHWVFKSNHFQYQWIGKLDKKMNWHASENSLFHEGKTYRRRNSWKRMHHRQFFWLSWLNSDS